jgi:hypothetical protein
MQDLDIEHLQRLVVDLLRPLAAAKPFLAQWPERTSMRSREPRHLPVCRFLPDLLARSVSSTQSLVETFVAMANALEWRQTYTVADLGPDFLEGYGWSELIGLRGPVPSENIACGFLLLAPAIEYPRRAHAAEEIYLPLAGEALWQRGDEGFIACPCGSPIHHPSWLPHATRTISALLCLYIWRNGDLLAKSRFV